MLYETYCCEVRAMESQQRPRPGLPRNGQVICCHELPCCVAMEEDY